MKTISSVVVIMVVFLLFSDKSQAQCNPPVTLNCSGIVPGGTSEFYLLPTPNNIDFSFDNFREYLSGTTISGSTTLKLRIDALNAACKWRLVMYLDNNASPGNEWETRSFYGGSGTIPEVDLIQVRVYNVCGTPQFNGIYRTFTNITTVLSIINNPILNPNGLCNGSEVNSPGYYLTGYGEYTFNIDYRIVPSVVTNYRPGIYELTLRFCLVED